MNTRVNACGACSMPATGVHGKTSSPLRSQADPQRRGSPGARLGTRFAVPFEVFPLR